MFPAPASGRSLRTPTREPPPPRDASFGRPRVNRLRMHLVKDRLPHEARNAEDTFTAAPTPYHVQASRSHGTAGSPSFRTPAALHTSTRAVFPHRPKRRPYRHPCGRSRFRSSNTTPFQGRRISRPSAPVSNITDQPRHVAAAALESALPPRANRDAAAPRAPHSTMRPAFASGHFLRMNRSRMPLVQDRLPREVRDADAVSAGEGTYVVVSDGARTTPRHSRVDGSAAVRVHP